MVLFINAVDELLSEKGLGFVTNIINIAFIALLAILITKGVRRLMQRLQNSHRITGDPVKQKRAETAETLMSSRTPNSDTICRMAVRYTSSTALFRLTVISSAASDLTLMNTSTLPLETAAFTACFTASSAKDTIRGSLTLQSR